MDLGSNGPRRVLVGTLEGPPRFALPPPSSHACPGHSAYLIVVSLLETHGELRAGIYVGSRRKLT